MKRRRSFQSAEIVKTSSGILESKVLAFETFLVMTVTRPQI